LIKPGLEKIQGNWRPEDIYCAIKTGVSTLHIADPEEYEGFVVLTPLSTISGKVLEVTACYSKSLRKFTEYQPEIERMARAIGAREFVFSSNRNWSRYFEPAYTVFRKAL